MKEARHHGAGAPITRLARDRADERVAVGREGKGTVDPCLDARIRGGGVAFEAEDQLVLDPVELFLKQLHAVVPRRAVHGPVFVIDLVDADKDAVLILAHVGEPFEVHGHGHFEVAFGHFGDGVGDQVVVFERGDRKLDSRHPAHLFGPKTGCIDHVLALNCSLIGNNGPAFGCLIKLQNLCVLVVFRSPFLGGDGIGVDGTGGVYIAFAVGPHRAQKAVGRHDRTALLCLFGRHELAILDTDGLIDSVLRLEPFPAVGRPRQR